MKKKHIVLATFLTIVILTLITVCFLFTQKERIIEHSESLFRRVWNKYSSEQYDVNEKAIVSPIWDYYSRSETGMPMGTNTFSIGEAVCLFNSARFAEDTAENQVELLESFSHVGTLISDEQGNGYCVASYNPEGNGDGPATETLKTVLSIVDLNKMELKDTVTVAEQGDVLSDGQRIVSGAGDANEAMLEEKIIRIVFSSQLSDGNWYELYRDYNLESGELSEIGYCFIEVEGVVLPFSNTAINQLLFNDSYIADGSFAFQGQTTCVNGEYYICIGCSSYMENGDILCTEDFITFHQWLLPDIEDNSLNHEAACYVFWDDLFVAFRQEDRNKLLIARIDLRTKEIKSKYECEDAQSRMCWFEYNGVLYLVHSVNNRYTINIERIEPNDLKMSTTVCQGYSFVYPSISIYNEKAYIVFSRNQRIYLSKFEPLPYNRNNTISVVNKVLDLYGNDSE